MKNSTESNSRSHAVCTRDQVLLAKRTAMRQFFFVASPIDDDYGFDRLMTFKAIEDIDGATQAPFDEGWGHIFLAEHKRGQRLELIQRWVFKATTELLVRLCDISPKMAIDAIQRHQTKRALNGDLTYMSDLSVPLAHSRADKDRAATLIAKMELLLDDCEADPTLMEACLPTLRRITEVINGLVSSEQTADFNAERPRG